MVKKENRIPKRLQEEIKKDGKKYIEVAREMANCSFEDQTIEREKEDYNEEFDRRVNNFKSYIRKYSSGEIREPRTNVLKLLQKAMNWSNERFQFALSPRDDTTDFVDYKDELRLEEYIKKGWKYVALELRTNAIYNNYDSLYTTKVIKIKSLVNNLEKIEKLIYSKFKSEEKDIDTFEIDCYPKYLIEIKKEYNSETMELNIDLFFRTPLNKGQEVTLFLHQFFTKIIDKDQTCHCTPILCPTLYTKLTVTPPPYVTKGRVASVSEYKSKDDFNYRSDGYRGEPITDLTLGESGNYEYEKSDPLVDHFFEIHWGS